MSANSCSVASLERQALRFLDYVKFLLLHLETRRHYFRRTYMVVNISMAENMHE